MTTTNDGRLSLSVHIDGKELIAALENHTLSADEITLRLNAHEPELEAYALKVQSIIEHSEQSLLIASKNNLFEGNFFENLSQKGCLEGMSFEQLCKDALSSPAGQSLQAEITQMAEVMKQQEQERAREAIQAQSVDKKQSSPSIAM